MEQVCGDSILAAHGLSHAMSAKSHPDASTPPDDAIAPVVAREADAGERVDRFLALHVPTLSRSRIKALIEAGMARRDGVRLAQPAEAVRAGAVYTLAPPPPLAATPQPQDIPFPVLFEDADIIVLDKPAGLVVHPAPGNPDGTLVNALLAHCGASLTGVGAERRPGIVHRLDKDTSGVMVVAKNDHASAVLTRAFAARDLDRFYLALCWGLPNPASGEIEAAIGRDPRDRKRMAVRAVGGKSALTRYRVLGSHAAAASLLECRLGTGRTHQIRVHLAHLGHPIVGDPVYLRRIPAAARGLAAAERAELLDFPRQALHAARLGFAHPRTGEALSFTTAPPEDMRTLLERLNLSGS
jgi:23S rRNA pseudouridine1911/1915/1917 synthase